MAINETLSIYNSGYEAGKAYLLNMVDPVKNTLEGKLSESSIEKMFINDDSLFISAFFAGLFTEAMKRPYAAYKAYKRK